MSRVKKGVNALKHRRNVLRRVKGYRHGRKSKERLANEAIVHAGTHAFAHRRDKKNDFRRLFQTRIGASAKALRTSYSKLMGDLKKKNILLDRKILSTLAADHPEVFAKIVAASK
ncbi:MAG: 50S ribosomal protein L20 [Candidatus Vogelbacteria bacterium CG10_big_fil_rev_8_21_14_0_10_51_16]|uniref:50S ribosomal protein L20 n=1 Tax=Candidatus Vogelbacteria bacterium CG10_big_fil_rev_8_21_14_0_10_51_16 TaxID=1975045 RepID=A0A2H0RFI9_9BACT|nr:MAG: 50S ribosomal protein L20 [Candidatus Vogelbacteria bacterium CG10_big_fil_rev_8_21_14_0_10_51_16]